MTLTERLTTAPDNMSVNYSNPGCRSGIYARRLPGFEGTFFDVFRVDSKGNITPMHQTLPLADTVVVLRLTTLYS